MGVWPENLSAYTVFSRVGTRWRYPPMGLTPIGLDWPAIYPLMDRQDSDWEELHDALMVMEAQALETIREFAPKPKD